MPRPLGERAARDLARARKQFSNASLTIGGTVYPVTTRALRAVEIGAYEPLGEDINAATSDPRLFTLSACDFPQAPGADAPSVPSVQSGVTYEGTLYRVMKVSPHRVAGVLVDWLLIAYRQAPPDSATTEPATETNPGQRKRYNMPASTV
jgi:hypothetical protein